MEAEYTGPVTVSIELVTPEMAAEWLKRNDSNRKLSSHTIERYAAEMRNNQWALTGETIAFYETGELKDGQHRLSAIVQTKKPQWMIVVRGIKTTVVIHDRGRGRTTGDIMTIAGYESAVRNNSSIGAVKFLFVNVAKIPDVSDNMCMQFIDEYGEYIAMAYSASMSGKTTANCRKAPIIAALFCAIYSGFEYETVKDFCAVVNSGFYSGEEKTAGIVFKEMVEKTLYSGNTQSRIEMFDYTLMALTDFRNGIKRRQKYSQVKKSRYAKKVADECFGRWKKNA